MTTFTTSRDYPVAPAAVFAAFGDPTRLARWWGPDGFTNSFEVCDFKPGGQWTFTMHAPDGTDYPNECVFTRIETDRLVVIDHTCQPLFRLTVRLTPSAAGTHLHWEQVFADAAVAQAVRHIVESANEQNLNRLGAEIA
ncbi:MAG: SRPBCC domain-containing protein [Rhodoferax sp.]|nr:SRPBCC domain-containing protein [Rhodoferax sp.]